MNDYEGCYAVELEKWGYDIIHHPDMEVLAIKTVNNIDSANPIAARYETIWGWVKHGKEIPILGHTLDHKEHKYYKFKKK